MPVTSKKKAQGRKAAPRRAGRPAPVVQRVADFAWAGQHDRAIEQATSALAAGDADRFRRAAHSLKSNANTFGAPGLGAMARGLENGGVGRAAAEGGAAVDALEAEYRRVAAALAELRDA
jgi:chemotaxis protein histidine kinase CheA